MTVAMRKLHSITAAVIAAVGVMNLARIDRTNLPENPAETIESQTRMASNIAAIFRRACQDCHSERTEWPWYSAVAPFRWLMAADVYAAREHMNLSTWGRYNEEERTGSLIGICEVVASNKIDSFTADNLRVAARRRAVMTSLLTLRRH